MSFVFNGGGLWSVLLIAFKKRRFNIDRAMMALMVFLLSGTYLACGRQAPLAEEQTRPPLTEKQIPPPAMEEQAPPSAAQWPFRASR